MDRCHLFRENGSREPLADGRLDLFQETAWLQGPRYYSCSRLSATRHPVKIFESSPLSRALSCKIALSGVRRSILLSYMIISYLQMPSNEHQHQQHDRPQSASDRANGKLHCHAPTTEQDHESDRWKCCSSVNLWPIMPTIMLLQ